MHFNGVSVGLVAISTSAMLANAQKGDHEQLVLADCGIGDNHQHPTWSTSRQMNWYKSLTWPSSARQYPPAPNMAVEIPYKDGIYPWVSSGLTANMPNGDDWTVWIAENTPEGLNAGAAMSYKNGGVSLNCWAYHGRPVSAAINKTVNANAICWSAFVCNKDDQAPKRASDQSPGTSSTVPISTTATSTATTTASVPTTSSEPSTTSQSTTETAAPAPSAGVLKVDTSVNPRFIVWPGTWEVFVNSFVWDQKTGQCVGRPFIGADYSINFDCSGVQIDSDTHMTLILIKALKDLGLHSLWFGQTPALPGNGTLTSSAPQLIMPEAFKITATDVANGKVLGSLSYKAQLNHFTTGSCSPCETQRFNAEFFTPILEAMKGTYPEFNDYRVEAICDPWVVCS
ncbi:hypothetical protein VHEMI05587 [[Torrubiella] hemipterigena]|uniref:Uncharacterized protein n=1 Tax=[Torrubiella] hemipterigena TaxID=1531966 RepID=A0A0A1TJ50_9HYPO|nr:hypothetical protein VHEMI05587 [[Torrubiella] hemipterigena]